MAGTGGIEIVSEVKAMGYQIHTALSGGAELPMTVRDAARFLGVSSQTVYLWVERKQIPHLRVMGRNIRFLKSDLEPFRAQFKYEVENGTA
jgi:excisionase family DNA binding protein